MSDCVTFPDTVDEFMEQYKIVDTEQVYTNGTELVPIFRMKQWFKHLPSAQPEQRWIPCSERYPDMDERVLVYTVAHGYHVWDCMSNRADNYFWEDEEGLYHDKYEADLWMPLPEPYRKDGD